MNAISEKLHKAANDKRLSGALLFVGLPGSGRKAVSQTLCQYLFCQARLENEPCQKCRACHQVSQESHPDLHIVRTDKKEIAIDQIRHMARWMAVFPNEGEIKFALIEDAQRLNRSSANALLRLLEEPPSHGVLVLLANSTANLLPTVRSRLTEVRFPTPLKPVFGNDSLKPPWLDDFRKMLSQPKAVTPNMIFSLTERVAKDRSSLAWFFLAAQAHLSEHLASLDKDNASARHLEHIFDLTLRTEQETLHRYGNVALGLDRLLLSWLSPS